jgi:hypothetical protein
VLLEPRAEKHPKTQGALKKNTTGLDVVGWFLGGQKSTSAGQISPEFFYRVFDLTSPRKAHKRGNEKSRKTRFCFFCRFVL